MGDGVRVLTRLTKKVSEVAKERDGHEAARSLAEHAASLDRDWRPESGTY